MRKSLSIKAYERCKNGKVPLKQDLVDFGFPTWTRTAAKTFSINPIPGLSATWGGGESMIMILLNEVPSLPPGRGKLARLLAGAGDGGFRSVNEKNIEKRIKHNTCLPAKHRLKKKV